MGERGGTYQQGLDQEMPGQSYMSPEAITTRLGKDITQVVVDESVMRMLTPMFSVGVVDAHDADNSRCAG